MVSPSASPSRSPSTSVPSGSPTFKPTLMPTPPTVPPDLSIGGNATTLCALIFSSLYLAACVLEFFLALPFGIPFLYAAWEWKPEFNLKNAVFGAQFVLFCVAIGLFGASFTNDHTALDTTTARNTAQVLNLIFILVGSVLYLAVIADLGWWMTRAKTATD